MAFAAACGLAACVSNPTPHPAGPDVIDKDTRSNEAGDDTLEPTVGWDDATTPPPADGDGSSTSDGADDADTGDAADAVEDATPPAPPVVTLTVNRIPAAMNGAIPWQDTSGETHPFALRVNREDATLDVVADLRAGGPVDWTTLMVTCSAGSAEVAIGALTPAADGGSASLAFTAEAPLPDAAAVTCRAAVSGPGGAAEASEVSFAAGTMPAELDPFATEDVWLVVLSRDIFALSTAVAADGTVALSSAYVAEGNGIPDFIEPFYVMGLMSPDHPEATEVVRAHLVRTIRRRAYEVFGLDAEGRPTPGGVRLRLYFEGDPGAPDPADFASGGFSMIALGGDGKPADQAAGTFGRALIDWNNQQVEDDTVYGLGVFPTGLVRAVLGMPLGVYLLADLLPSAGGVPIGADPGDAVFIGKDDDELEGPLPAGSIHRQEVYILGVDMGGLALSSILCHEMGHSLGLVPFGPPAEGLFAGVDGPEFLESFAPDAHIDTEGLNIMQTGGSVDWTQALGSEPRFNPLNWAYLRRQIIVGGVSAQRAPRSPAERPSAD
ncbi:MAG: hypothetical protein CVU56_28155 [Deltaproteobacteria bacterium HGW-Deltaproteobacteria-14]|jgi:hypothetical protein|nr:MAG: hypothetical protein CVU56_28155 [Deltaproteobacteria bacterium HGW-Deltaproteobacteria-14]